MEDEKIVSYHKSGSFYTGNLPEGCIRCLNGEKLVIYVTGKCRVGCYYCTVGNDKYSIDKIVVNDLKIDKNDALNSLIQESVNSVSTGAGLTGGDPLETPERVLKFISELRNEFGSQYHLHMYTSGTQLLYDYGLANQIFDAGLDELRIHPRNIKNMNIWKLAVQIKNDFPTKAIGFEVPVIPTKILEIRELIFFAEQNSLDFVILNELEFTNDNFTRLEKREFESVLHKSAVKGSYSSIKKLMEEIKDKIKINVHFCSSGSKDAIQLTNRYKHRAHQIARPFESISNEGELEYGKFEVSTTSEFIILLDLIEQIGLTGNLLEIKSNFVLETSWIVVDEFTDLFREIIPNLKAEIVIKYPIDNGPIVGKEPK